MAKLYGIEVKNIRSHIGRDGYATYCNIYMDGKMVGFYDDAGDGGEAAIEFEKKEDGQEFYRRRVNYFTKHRPTVKGAPVKTVETAGKYAPDGVTSCKDIDASVSTDDDAFVFLLMRLKDFEKGLKKHKTQYVADVCIEDCNGHAMCNYSVFVDEKKLSEDIKDLLMSKVRGAKSVSVMYYSMADLNVVDSERRKAQ